MASLARTLLAVGTLGTSEGVIQGAQLAGKAAEEGVKKIDEATGAKDARDQMAKQGQDSLDLQSKQIQDAKDAQKQQQDQFAQQAQNAQVLQMARARRGMVSSSRSRGTILGSPLGAPTSAGQAPIGSGQKTILGG